MITQFSSISPVDRTLLCATTEGQNGPGSNANEGVLCIPKSSCNTEGSPSDCLVSYAGHLLGEFYPSAEMQSVCILQPQFTGTKLLNKLFLEIIYFNKWQILTACQSMLENFISNCCLTLFFSRSHWIWMTIGQDLFKWDAKRYNLSGSS